MPSGLVHREGGAGDDLLLLLHGLGATGAVWSRLTPLLGDRRWAAPARRGHGSSPAAPPWGDGTHAADAAALAVELGAARVTVLGHSFGGVVGAVLGTGWFGVEVARVVAVGVKIEWTREEEAGASRMAGRPPQVFPTREEAAVRALKLAGLHGLADPADPVAAVREVDGGWTTALDPRAFSAVGPSVAEVLAGSRAPLRLAAGSADPMVGPDAMRRIDPDAVVVEGAGHNAHWEVPDAVRALLDG